MAVWSAEQVAFLLGNMTLEAITSYAKMASTLPAPESFIRDICAYNTFHNHRRRASIELPARTFLYLWNIDRGRLSDLGSFRVDLAIFREQPTTPDPSSPNLEALVEFKLWTDRYKIASDIKRLKTLCDLTSGEGQSSKVSGYAIACPQYRQGLEMTNSALDDLGDRFPLCFRETRQIEVAEDVTYGVGVAVIDIHQCIEGAYG